jgi:solute carrier family 35 protein F5
MAPAEPLMPAELAPERDERSRPSSSRRRSGSVPLIARGLSRSSTTTTASSLRARFGLLGVARRTLGIALLLFTVLMWTVSNFLASVSYPVVDT